MRWLALALVVGCTEEAARSDAGLRDASPREPPALDASCAPREVRSVWDPKYFDMELEALCAMIAEAGERCPRSPDEFLHTVDCAREASAIVFGRCELDTYYADQPAGDRWTFDHAGVLVGARVQGRYRCGDGVYTTAAVPCELPERVCAICLRGADAACPADVLSAFPGGACAVAPGVECVCSPNDDLPRPGTPCSPVCERCAGGTCWTYCACNADGVYRTALGCTE